MARSNSTTLPPNVLAPEGETKYAESTVATKRTAVKLTVCILSPHPVVLSEFERLLAKAQFKVGVKQLESTLAPDLRNLEIPPAKVYVIDAHAAKPATGALLANIMERFPESRLDQKSVV